MSTGPVLSHGDQVDRVSLLQEVADLKARVRADILALRDDIADPESELLLANMTRLFQARMEVVLAARKKFGECRPQPIFEARRDMNLRELFKWWKSSKDHHRRELNTLYVTYPGTDGNAMGRILNSLQETGIETLGDLRDLFTSEHGDRFNPIWLAYYLSEKRTASPGSLSSVHHGEIQMSNPSSQYMNAHAETIIACLEYIGAIDMNLQWQIPPQAPPLPPRLQTIQGQQTA
jgi:hypothetical protein